MQRERRKNVGLIHTRHFGTQYFDIAIKRYCNKNILFFFKILKLHFKIVSNKQKKIFSIHTMKKNIG